MATLKDFVLNKGLVVNTTATVAGVNVLANDYATYVTLAGKIDLVQDNVALAVDPEGFQANDFATYLWASSNDYNTLLSARSNDFATFTTITSDYAANDFATWNAAKANDWATWGAAQGNDHATLLTARANDFATWNTLTINTGATLNTARANDWATWGAAQGNDHSTLLSARSNDFATFTTLTSNFQANDGVTLNSARANDWATWGSAQGNDHSTLLTARSNDFATWNSSKSNDWATYSTLVNEYQANDFTTYNTLLNNYRANDFNTWNGLVGYVNLKANASITISPGTGLAGGGDLTANRTLSVDATVVRTSGDQVISGAKTFSDSVIVNGDFTVNGNVTTVSSSNLDVTDRFIMLASNATGAPAADVGLYFARGNQGNSALFYDESLGYFSFAHTLDPKSNTIVSPTGYADLRLNRLYVDSTSLVTNLNADLLDGQSGGYYQDFVNATNTQLITLDRVLANGNSSSQSISIGRITIDSNLFHTDSTNNFVGINILNPSSALQVEQLGIETSSLATTTTTANQVLDTFAAGVYRTAKYMVQVHDTANNDYHATELLLIHDGTTVYLTEYAIIYSDISLASFNADISGGNVRLLVTPTNTTNTIRVSRMALAV